MTTSITISICLLLLLAYILDITSSKTKVICIGILTLRYIALKAFKINLKPILFTAQEV